MGNTNQRCEQLRSLVVPESSPEDISEEADKVRSMSWIQRLKRVFGIDVEICSKCRGKNKIISAVEDPKVIEEILIHLGLEAPPLWTPRGPPQIEESFTSL